MSKTFYLVFFYFAVFCVQNSCGDYLLESYMSSLECYKFEQEGCDKEFIDEHPEVSLSYNNLTKAKTRFYLFTIDNPDDPELMHKCGGGLPPKTKFNPKCRTEIFIPGFLSGVCNMAVFRELKNERLKCGCSNVILVDWTWGNGFDLISAKNNSRIMAKQIAIVIKGLKEKYSLPPEHFIVTGHSLGAHAAGFVGQEEPIGIINGIEPSILYPESTPLNERLDSSDAKCVQVMHCNSGPCFAFYTSDNFSLGTHDFYINGGQFQASCYPQIFESILKGDFLYALFSLYPAVCSHFHCLQYYKASMCTTNCKFIGVKCESSTAFEAGNCRDCGNSGRNCAIMGANACDCNSNKGEPNNYYLNTALSCPFCDNSGINTRGYSCPYA